MTYPRLWYLALTAAGSGVTADSCEKPFRYFSSLTSLSLELGEKTKKNRLAMAVNSCANLESLELSMAYPQIQDSENGTKILSRLTKTEIMNRLIHFHVRDFRTVEYKNLEEILFCCRQLETLRVGRVSGHKRNRPRYPGLVTSRDDVSQRLRSVAFYFHHSDNDDEKVGCRHDCGTGDLSLNWLGSYAVLSCRAVCLFK